MATAAKPRTQRSTTTEAVFASLALDGMGSAKAPVWGRWSYLRIAAEPLGREESPEFRPSSPIIATVGLSNGSPSPPYRPARTRQATFLATEPRPLWCGASTTRTWSRRRPPRLSGQGHAPPTALGRRAAPLAHGGPDAQRDCDGESARPLRPAKRLSWHRPPPRRGFLRFAPSAT